MTVAAVELTRRGLLVPTGKRGELETRHGQTPRRGLEWELWSTASAAGPLTVRRLRARLAAGQEASDLERRLIEDRLLISPERRRRVGVMEGLLLAVLALGVARLVAGSANHKPVGYLTLEVLGVICARLWLAARRPSRTSAGERALKEARLSNAPHARLLITVATNGLGALWSSNPGLATALAVPRERGFMGSTFTGGGYYGGGGGCGSGGGGGGGGGCGGGGGGCGG